MAADLAEVNASNVNEEETEDELSVNAFDAWVNYDMEKNRSIWDQQSLHIVDNQDSSVRSRKALADSTKAFKKNYPDLYKNNFAGLLKEYQAEIDRLTDRAKFSEKAFVDVYKGLDTLPDPTPFLKRGVEDEALVADLQQRLLSMETQRSAIELSAGERAEYEDVLESLRRELQALDGEVEQRVHVAVAEAQKSFSEVQQQNIEQFEHREAELHHQLAASNEAYRIANVSIDALKAQLFESQARVDELRSANASTMEMASTDEDRKKDELFELRRRCRELEQRLSAGAMTNTTAPNVSLELAAKDVQVSQLLEQVESLKEAVIEKESEFSAFQNENSKLLAARDEEIQNLLAQIQTLPSVQEFEELKQRTETLKTLQLDEGNEEDESSSTLEKKLFSRLKNLESKLTKMRVDLLEKEAKCKVATKKAMEFEDRLEDQKALVSRLEEGINSMTVEKKMDREVPANLPDHRRDTREDMTMLEIVTGQRDRFRARVQEIEEDNRKLLEKLGSQKAEQEALKADNVQLYAKIRYLQSYKDSAGTNSGQASVTGDDPSFLQKYHHVYEESMNPFTAFNRRERNRRINELSTAERMTLRAGQTMLGTKFSRLFLLCYVVVLHLFVFIVLSRSRSICTEVPLPESPE